VLYLKHAEGPTGPSGFASLLFNLWRSPTLNPPRGMQDIPGATDAECVQPDSQIPTSGGRRLAGGRWHTDGLTR